MGSEGLTRRTVLRSVALATTALSAPFVRNVYAVEKLVPSGSMVLGWHTNIAPRWLDPLQHDGGATGDNFLNVPSAARFCRRGSLRREQRPELPQDKPGPLLA